MPAFLQIEWAPVPWSFSCSCVMDVEVTIIHSVQWSTHVSTVCFFFLKTRLPKLSILSRFLLCSYGAQATCHSAAVATLGLHQGWDEDERQ